MSFDFGAIERRRKQIKDAEAKELEAARSAERSAKLHENRATARKQRTLEIERVQREQLDERFSTDLLFRVETQKLCGTGARVTLPSYMRAEYNTEIKTNSRPAGFVLYADGLRFRGTPKLSIDDWFVRTHMAKLSGADVDRYLDACAASGATITPFFHEEVCVDKIHLDYTQVRFIAAKKIQSFFKIYNGALDIQAVCCDDLGGFQCCVHEEDGDVRRSRSMCHKFEVVHWYFEQLNRLHARDFVLRGYIKASSAPVFVVTPDASSTLLALSDSIRSRYSKWKAECGKHT